MKKQLLLMASVLAITSFTLPSVEKIAEAINSSNPEQIRQLLQRTALTSTEKARLLKIAQAEREQAQLKLDSKKFSIRDGLRIATGSAAAWGTATLGTIALGLGVFSILDEEDGPNIAIPVVTLIASSFAGYLAHRQFYKGFTKYDRTIAVTNALAVEDLISTALVE